MNGQGWNQPLRSRSVIVARPCYLFQPPPFWFVRAYEGGLLLEGVSRRGGWIRSRPNESRRKERGSNRLRRIPVGQGFLRGGIQVFPLSFLDLMAVLLPSRWSCKREKFGGDIRIPFVTRSHRWNTFDERHFVLLFSLLPTDSSPFSWIMHWRDFLKSETVMNRRFRWNFGIKCSKICSFRKNISPAFFLKGWKLGVQNVFCQISRKLSKIPFLCKLMKLVFC